MKILSIILIMISLCLSFDLRADGIGYSESLRIEIESKDFIVIHFHDWTDKTRDNRFNMISTHQNPFLEDNDYSYIECISKKTGKVVFKKPCPALTRIQISSDQKFIIGISNVKLWNPYQLAIFDITGMLIKKRNISSKEAKLSTVEFINFKDNFKTQLQFLDSLNRVYKIDRDYYIDFATMGMPDALGDAWNYLFKYISPNHLSNNFTESVTNWIFWYNSESPNIEFDYGDNELLSISLLDPNSQKFKIKLIE